jgi:CBS-domain-containing membrane protein
MTRVAYPPPKQESLPPPSRFPDLTSMPDVSWTPIAAAAIVLIVGVVALLFSEPWLIPSLGPTAYLYAESPKHPNSRAWNVVLGHGLGFVAACIAVYVFAANGHPPVLTSRDIDFERLAASVLAVFLASAAMKLTNSNHPPALATVLIVTLGSLTVGWRTAGIVAVAVILTAIVGELFRRARGGRDLLP